MEFRKIYGFPQHESRILLAGIDYDTSYKKSSEDFMDGNFRVKNLANAEFQAERIKNLERFNKKVANNRYFIMAIMRVFTKCEKFDYNHFVHKIGLQPNSFVPAVNVKGFLDIIEKIYNHGTRRDDRISLAELSTNRK